MMSEKYYLGGIVLAIFGLTLCFDGLKAVRGQNSEKLDQTYEATDFAEAATEETFSDADLAPVDPEYAEQKSPSSSVSSPIPAFSEDVFSSRRARGRKSTQQHQLQRHIAAAVKKIQETETIEDKQEIIFEMKELFTKYFDHEIKQREEKLAPLENRVKKLRAQIDKRKEAKEKIIQLQLQLIEHQAEGLGFFTEPQGTGTVQPQMFGVAPDVSPGSAFYNGKNPSLPTDAVPAEEDPFGLETPGKAGRGLRNFRKAKPPENKSDNDVEVPF